MSRFCSARAAALAALGIAATAATAHAGGLFVPGFGPQAMGRAGAFVARADDPSALHHNPAGLARTRGTVLQLGAGFLDLSLDYQRAGTYETAPGEDLDYAGTPYAPVRDASSPAVGLGPLQAVPLVAVTLDPGLGRISDHAAGLRLAVGVMAPQAYPDRRFTSDFTFDDGNPDNGAPPPQRYDVMEQQALVVLPSVALAYRVGHTLDLGVRASWGIARMQASTYLWGLRNYEEWVARDGLFALDVGDDFVPAWSAGVLYRPASWLELGAAYTSALHVDARGTGSVVLGNGLGVGPVRESIMPDNDTPRCAPGGTAEALSTCLRLDLPQTATVGARWIWRDRAGAERADIELDLRWEDWSAASDYRIIVDGRTTLLFERLEDVVVRHGLQDVLSVRLGGSYRIPGFGPGSGPGAGHMTVRGGLAHDTAAAPTTWQRLDLDGAARTTLAAGLAYELAGVRVDLAAGMVHQSDRTVAACNPDVTNPGCPPGSGDAPVDERTGPDPLQPTREPGEQQQSPFNAGTYSSRYLLLGLGVTAQF